MALALSLVFDASTGAAVERIWRELAAAGVSSDMLDLGYPPHVTLIVTDDEGLSPAFSAALAQLAPLVPKAMQLGEVRSFPGTEVVYVAAAGELMELHRAAAACVPIDCIHPYYRPGAWTPHVTLQIAGDAVAAAEIANAHWQPGQTAVPVRLEVAAFVPVVVQAGVALPYR